MTDNGSDILRECIATIEIAMLTTVEAGGQLRSRPMYTLQMDSDGILWFFTPVNSLKLDEIEKNPQVNICYTDINSHTYISITAAAEIVYDVGLKEKFREFLHEDWYPSGEKAPELCLLKIRVEHAEKWNAGTVSMENILH